MKFFSFFLMNIFVSHYAQCALDNIKEKIKKDVKSEKDNDHKVVKFVFQWDDIVIEFDNKIISNKTIGALAIGEAIYQVYFKGKEIVTKTLKTDSELINEILSSKLIYDRDNNIEAINFLPIKQVLAADKTNLHGLVQYMKYEESNIDPFIHISISYFFLLALSKRSKATEFHSFKVYINVLSLALINGFDIVENFLIMFINSITKENWQLVTEDEYFQSNKKQIAKRIATIVNNTVYKEISNLILYETRLIDLLFSGKQELKYFSSCLIDELRCSYEMLKFKKLKLSNNSLKKCPFKLTCFEHADIVIEDNCLLSLANKAKTFFLVQQINLPNDKDAKAVVMLYKKRHIQIKKNQRIFYSIIDGDVDVLEDQLFLIKKLREAANCDEPMANYFMLNYKIGLIVS